jgi:putative transposase
VSDITYLKTGEGWLYLTAVMDLADIKIVGWALSEGMSAEQTTLAALERALKARKAGNGLIFHSDRGIQYACNDFKDKLKGLKIGVVQSMSRKGNCWDNSVMENFFKTAKSEKFNRYNFKTKQDAKLCVFRYIEGWYNKSRLHSTIGYKTPDELEMEMEKAA